MFEIHITVATDNIKKFKYDCEFLKIKPIILDLQDQRTLTTIQQDVMTSSKHAIKSIKGKYLKTSVFHVPLVELKWKLRNMKYDIIREKIELDAVYYDKYITRIRPHEDDQYYESHIRVLLDKSKEELLRTICVNHGFYLYKNILKKSPNAQEYYLLATLRVYKTTLLKFRINIDKFLIELLNHYFTFSKVEVEFCLYDSKTNHDNKWMKNI